MKFVQALSLVFVLGFLPTVSLVAQTSDVRINWTLLDLTFNGREYSGLHLDLQLTPRFIRANGIILEVGANAAQGQGVVAATGTCFSKASEGYQCVVQVSQFALELNIDNSFAGNYVLRDSAGISVRTGTLLFLGIS